jgi:hypothetical protein
VVARDIKDMPEQRRNISIIFNDQSKWFSHALIPTSCFPDTWNIYYL